MSILTVSELNRAVAQSLELHFPLMRVRGEIAQLTRAASGHWYFTLRDAGASVRAVMFRARSAQLDWGPKEGDQVEVSAVVSLYEPRGEFQIRVETMVRSGQGALYEAFLARKEKLGKAGLLDASRKRPLPDVIRTVGLVTSLGAAALRDVVVTLTRLAPRIHLRVYPSLVQGAEAPAQLCRQLQAADADAQVDVLVLVRGGGSLEDLWAFNDEALAETIARCQHCVVVGVGHETDVTIADLVADIRAATPTAAAQRIAEVDQRARERLLDAQRRTRVAIVRRWELAQQRLDRLAQRVRSPREELRNRRSRLALAAAALRAAMRAQSTLRIGRHRTLSAQLTALDPTAILQRGYAMVSDDHGRVIMDPAQVKPDDPLTVRLAKGTLGVRVQPTRSDKNAR
ncbi:MAG: exodeoxyribonuclease VII large subunit [Burkholderiaceae bacterium]